MKFVMTKQVRRYAIEHLGCSLTSTDAQIIDAVAKAVADNKLSKAKLAKLCSTQTPADNSAALAKSIADAVSKALADAVPKKDTRTDTKTTPEGQGELVNNLVNKRLQDLGLQNADGSTPTTLLSKSSQFSRPDQVRLKSASEQYDNTRKGAICPQTTATGGRHSKAGQPAQIAGRCLDHPSELDKACIGSYFKWALATSSDPRDIPRQLQLTDHDRDLVNWSMRNHKWTGNIKALDQSGKLDNCKMSEYQIKGLLDDSTSGGVEAAPVVFDDAVILTPILFGEFFPDVNLINIARGRRIHGFSMGNPTFTSGTPEGMAIQPFDTSSFIAAFDTTVYNAVGAMEIGLDFEEDAPADIGGIVIERYGLQAMAYLDRVIPIGDGVVEPLGFFNSTGTTVVNSDNNIGGPPTVSDYEGLMFGLPKQFRKEAGARTLYAGNELSYRRSRSIPVGPTDERRVFGMTHQDYRLLDTDYRINAFIPNNMVAYINLKRYRMYRRLGLTVRVETAGNYLASRNLKLIVLRMRFGGQLELGQACAVSTDMQS